MWKVALLLIALFVVGHFAVRYLRTNPLDPVLEGGQLVVETTEHEVRFSLDGPVQGTYLVAKAESQDFGDEPVNATLSVVDLATTREYLRAHPNRLAYGSGIDLQLENLSAPLALIAANRLAYGELRGLIDRYEDRVQDGGKWLCVTISGDALGVDAAESLDSGVDATALYVNRAGAKRLLLATLMRVEDCDESLDGR
jgi:hypothetical protein